MIGYFISVSSVAVVPARRAAAMHAAGLPANFGPPARNIRSRKESSVPLGEAKYTGEPMTSPSAPTSRSIASLTISSNAVQRPLHLRQAMQPWTVSCPIVRICVSIR